jgi:hypothetical protein
MVGSSSPPNSIVEKSEKQERTPRGMVPPALRLTEAVALAHKVNEMAAGSANYDTFSQIAGNTKTSSTFARKVAALRQYGIIEDRENIVCLAELGNRIVTPRDESDDLLAMKESMLRIEMLNKIYERHKGRILPEDQFLNNVLLQELKVPREYSKVWVEHFKDAIQAAKLVITRVDGKTQLVEQAVVAESSGEAAPPLVQPPPPAAVLPTPTDFSGALPIPLGKGRIALLRLPDEWDAKKDLSRLLKMIALSLSEDGAEEPEP